MNAIIYTRTATNEQSSCLELLNQKRALISYCTSNQIEIVNHFQDIFSGMTFNRPEWVKLIDFITNNDVDEVLVTSWNRLGRDFLAVNNMIEKLSALNVKVKSINNSEFSNFNFIMNN